MCSTGSRVNTFDYKQDIFTSRILRIPKGLISNVRNVTRIPTREMKVRIWCTAMYHLTTGSCSRYVTPRPLLSLTEKFIQHNAYFKV